MITKNISESLRDYTADNIPKHLTKAMQEVFYGNHALMTANYKGSVDAQLLDRQILICDATYGALYSKEWEKTDYVQGSRPELEKIVNELTSEKKSDFEKVLPLMRLCRDLYKRMRYGSFYKFGGTEENLIEKGEELCECLARLMVSLCEVASVPGRIVTHIVGGHLTTELFIDGKWTYLDPRAGIFFVRPDGELASIRDLILNPEIMDNQPDWVKSEVSDRWTWEFRKNRCKNIYFTEKEINTVKPYSLSESHLYSYKQLSTEELWYNDIENSSNTYNRAISNVLGETYSLPQIVTKFSFEDGETITNTENMIIQLFGFCISPPKVDVYLDGIYFDSSPAFCPSDTRGSFVSASYRIFPYSTSINKGAHNLEFKISDWPEYRASINFTI